MSTIVLPSRTATVAPAITGVQPAAPRLDSAKGLAAMLLAAMVAALVVLGDQLINTWADEHLLVAWIALWVVVFSAVALLASSSRQLAGRLLASFSASRERARQIRADDELWALAQGDARVMADLRAAISRAED